jgi:hypothetical protein
MLALLLALWCVGISAQIPLSGRVVDGETGGPLPGVAIWPDGAPHRGTTTDAGGRFALNLPVGTDSVHFRMLGYAERVWSVEMTEKITEWKLYPQTIAIEQAAEIQASRGDHTQGTQLGVQSLKMREIEALPALFGEVDVLRAIQLLPGIQAAGEGNTGFYVRGGGPDQNLLLLDRAVVYNPAHLLGFFSVFNPDVLGGVEVVKGTMPAQYGGRISSVVDLSTREEPVERLGARGGLGLISSRLMVETPWMRGGRQVGSWWVAGRRTYLDALVRPFLRSGAFSGSGYHFYDLNFGGQIQLSPRDRIRVMGYHGRDVFQFSSAEVDFSTRIPWGNTAASVTWQRVVSDVLLQTVYVTHSATEFAFEGGQDAWRFGFKSGLQDAGGGAEWGLQLDPRLRLRWGAQYTYRYLVPVKFSAQSGTTTFDTGEAQSARGHETGGFAAATWDLGEAVRVDAGLRRSDYFQVGPFSRTLPPAGPGAAEETLTYGRGEIVAQYGGWEPRVALRILGRPGASWKVGWSRNLQYIHLTSLSATSLPTDIWIPASDRIGPQRGEQWTAGYFREWGPDGRWEASVEVYHKALAGLVEYRENARPEDNIGNNIDQNLVTGTGTSYGVETFLKRGSGPWTGWLSYTWSKTDRLFPDLNRGVAFPAKFDRRHDISVVGEVKLSDRWRASFTWVYATGNTLTLPVQRYLLEGRIAEIYGTRNGFRMPPYHRADVGFTYTPPPRRARLEQSWNFSIYNLYNRLNPYFIYFANAGDWASGTLDLQAYQVSLFPILPSVTWNFRF